MKATLTSLAVAVAALFAVTSVSAQDAPKARADVKKEAAAANKSGKIAEGEVDKTGASDQKNVKSVKPRAEVKEEAKAAAKKEAANPGDASPKDGSAGKSTAARADVKADAAKAKKAGEIVQGEGSGKTKP